MNNENNNNFIKKCFWVVRIISLVIITMSVAVLIGWKYDIPVLKNISPSWPSMKVNTAICFVLSGFTLFLFTIKTRNARNSILILILSSIILIISSLTLIEFFTGHDFGIDEFFIEEDPSAVLGSPGRMAFSTALAFILVACNFLVNLNKKISVSVSQTLALFITVIALVSFYNFIINADLSYKIAIYSTAAVYTSLLLILLSIAILLIKPNSGFIDIALKKSTGGLYLRRILPFIIFTPICFSLLANYLQGQHYIDSKFGDSIIAAGTFLILSLIVTFVVRKIDKEETNVADARIKSNQNAILLREFAENTDTLFYRNSLDFKEIYYVSPAYEKIFGRSLKSLIENPLQWYESVHPEDKERVHAIFFEELQKKVSVSAEFRITRPDGSLRNIFTRAYQLKDKTNNLNCVMGTAIDITDEILEKKYLQTQNQILAITEIEKSINDVAPKILKIICEVFSWDLGELWLLETKSQVLQCAHSWHKPSEILTNFERESRKYTFKLGQGFPGKILQDKKPIWIVDYSKQQYLRSENAAQANLQCAFGVPIIFQDTVYGTLQFFSQTILEPDEKLLLLMDGFAKLIGEFINRLQRNKQFQTMARHDLLTGLLNRATFEAELDRKTQDNLPDVIALFVLDIDRFRIINESLGQALGDSILIQVAKRLESLVDYDKSNLARLGSDKFCLYNFNIKNTEEILLFARKIESTIKTPFIINDLDYVITLTIGISIYPQNGLDSKSLIVNADLAMQAAKNDVNNKIVFFTNKLPAIALEKLSLYSDLRIAITNKQFFLNLQPQIDLRTGEICGAEALVRWKHPQKGLISPNSFVGLAEKTGLIVALNEYVARIVFEYVNSDWEGPPISINISAQQIRDKFHLVVFLELLMKEFNVNPKNIELEITEGVLMEDTVHNLSVLSALAQLGFNIALDDFGTGFSSFSYLYRIPADKIKIDKAFISGLPANYANAQIVKAMIKMLHSLHKQVVAEGVETEDEMQFLKANHCDIAQGFYCFKPVSIEQFSLLIKHLTS